MTNISFMNILKNSIFLLSIFSSMFMSITLNCFIFAEKKSIKLVLLYKKILQSILKWFTSILISCILVFTSLNKNKIDVRTIYILLLTIFCLQSIIEPICFLLFELNKLIYITNKKILLKR